MSGAPSRNRVAALTPTGRGAVAVVAAFGPAALAATDESFRAANKRLLREQPFGRVTFGHWQGADGRREEVIGCRVDADNVEIHCHGGSAAVARIVEAFNMAGCATLSWTEWLRSAAKNTVAAEADVALARATTLRTAVILLDQRNGALAEAVKSIANDLARGDMAAARQKLLELLDRAALGFHLTQPWRVAIAGPPNVGKSSLINAIVGFQRAIVYDEPGTTRDVLAAETAIDGWPVQLTDSAGLRETNDLLEAEGVRLAAEQMRRADLVVWTLDASQPSHAPPPAEALLAFNKIDLVEGASAPPPLGVSALTGQGLDELLRAIAGRLVPHVPPVGAAVPFTADQVDALRIALRLLDDGQAPAAVMQLEKLTAAAR